MTRTFFCFLFLGGCGTAFVEGTDVSAFTTDGGAKKSDGGAHDDGGLGCIPQTCDDKGWKCGEGDNGCGSTVTCKPCDAPSQCASDHACKCEPATCASLKVECGTFPDGCGGADLQCGRSCPTGQSCSAGKCQAPPCTPATACGKGQCGSISDGCGGVLTCSSCQAPESCGGTGVANQCGCTKKTREDAWGARHCGTVSDGCGGTVDCGICAAGTGCDTTGACTAAACVPRYTCATKGYGCGAFVDDCGVKQTCGAPKYNATSTLCTTTTTASTGYPYAHMCSCADNGTCKSGPYAGFPNQWNCMSPNTSLPGRYCCKEIH